MPKVSVIVPIYNVEAYLPKCFDSLRKQTFQDFEVLAVNDGSPDQSQKIIDQTVLEDKRFVALKKENGGLSDARNYAIPFVQGEFIFFLDSDDSLVPEALEHLVQKAEKDGADLVICGYNEVSCNGRPSRPVVSSYEPEVGSLKQHPEILNKLPHCAWNKLYKASLFKEKGITYPKGLYYEDCGTSPIVYLEAQRISVLKEPLIDYLIDRPGNITQSVNRKIMDVVANLKRVNDYYRDRDAFEIFRKELCLFNLRLIYDNLWKLKLVKEDREFIDTFFEVAFQHLNDYFPEWRKNSYFKHKKGKDLILAWIMKRPRWYQAYLSK